MLPRWKRAGSLRRKSLSQTDLTMNASAKRRAQPLLTGPFVLAVLALAVAAILAGPVAGWIGFVRVKSPLPLKTPIAAFNTDALGPYRLVPEYGRRVLDSAVVDALGTEEYLYWIVEDTRPHPFSDAYPSKG